MKESIHKGTQKINNPMGETSDEKREYPHPIASKAN